MEKYIFPPDSKDTLDIFEDNYCDNCNETVSLDFYRGIGSCDIDICLDCFNKPLDELFKEHEHPYCTCNVCGQYINTGKIHNISDFHTAEDFDVCYKCWPTLELKKCFLRINKDTCEDLILTESKYYIFSIKSIELDVPTEFQKEVKDEDLRNKYIGMVYNIVRPPCTNWNPHGWALITSFKDFSMFNASCSFAIRCQLGEPHQICSVLEDDHGRCAMNIIYQDHLEYLKDLNEWEEVRDKDIDSYLNKIKKALDEDEECDNELIMKATDNFAVYTRIKLDLPLDYG